MSKYQLFLFSFVLLFVFACGGGSSDRVSDVVEATESSAEAEAVPTESAESSAEAEAVPTESAESSEEAEAVPTEAAESSAEAEVVPTESAESSEETEVVPTESAESSAEAEAVPTESAESTSAVDSASAEEGDLEPLTVIKHGFGQDEGGVGFGLIIQNPNTTHAFENVPVQVILYNDEGTVLETTSNYVEIILPGQTLGVGGSLYLDEKMTPSEMEVKLESSSSDAVVADSVLELQADAVTHFSDDLFLWVTGDISNPYDEDLKNIKISAISYDENGEINGGGSSSVNFILASGTTGTSVFVTSSSEPATVELYAFSSKPTPADSADTVPEGAQNISLIQNGYGQKNLSVGYGFIVENPNEGLYIEDTQYRITAYDSDDKVLAVDEGFLETVLPTQTLGVAVEFLAQEAVARAELQILSGEFNESATTPLFTSENVEYNPDEFFPTVTGEIVSSYQNDVTEIRVSAIAYDASGEIMGSGFTYVDLVPANGKAAAEVSLTADGVPERVELYPAVSGLSVYKE